MLKCIKKIVVILIFFVVLQGTSFAQSYDDYYNSGYSSLMEGSLKESINSFKSALRINPDSYEAYLAIGMAYRLSGQLNLALQSTRKALQIRPDFYKAYYNLGLILEEQGEYKEAAAAYKTFYNNFKGAKRIPNLKEKIKTLENR